MAAMAAMTLALVGCGGGRSGPSAPPGRVSRDVHVRMQEWRITLSVRKGLAGRVTFSVHNAGMLEHEFLVVRTQRAASRLPLAGGLVDESAAGVDAGEIDDIAPGHTTEITLTLKPGHYALICNDAGPPAHYRSGMHADFWVTTAAP